MRSDKFVSYDTKTKTSAAVSDLSAIKAAYDFFNRKLFDGELGEVYFTLNRRNKTLGYFHEDKFRMKEYGDEVKMSELALNPDTFLLRTDEEILSTLVHEMCHVWQAEKGKKKSKKGYHNKEWGNKMESVGLIPSSTGKVGGKKTGQSMSHYIDDTGKFKTAVSEFLDQTTKEWSIAWGSLKPERKPKCEGNKAKIKYSCPGCSLSLWGKPGVRAICGDCNLPLMEV